MYTVPKYSLTTLFVFQAAAAVAFFVLTSFGPAALIALYSSCIFSCIPLLRTHGLANNSGTVGQIKRQFLVSCFGIGIVCCLAYLGLLVQALLMLSN